MGNTVSTHLEPMNINSKFWKDRYFEDKPIVDSEYFFPDGNIIVLVQNTAFKLYRGMLQVHSELFLGTEENAVRIKGPVSAEVFGVLCQFIFPSEVGVMPIIQPGDIKKWRPVVNGTVELGMQGAREYILNKLVEDKAVVTANAPLFLSWIQDSDEGLKELLLGCIQVLAYRQSPLSHDEARNLSGERANMVALARERVRSLFYNPNYWKVRVPGTLCRATTHHCSEGIFRAMTTQMTSTKSSKLSPEPVSLFRLVEDTMCTACRGRYADSIKQHANLEIKRCLESSPM
ncbi:unnamed protein product [Rhizoctonia solani]|uniref:Uncharacterized protein n=1 Tax=Rhizoctonia solani TaxID=456999 RepID=A0A8H2XXM6_9AGAM|nr:unnamed protein product [Rhizoctonia solani]